MESWRPRSSKKRAKKRPAVAARKLRHGKAKRSKWGSGGGGGGGGFYGGEDGGFYGGGLSGGDW